MWVNWYDFHFRVDVNEINMQSSDADGSTLIPIWKSAYGILLSYYR